MIGDLSWLVGGLLGCLLGAEGLIRGAVDLSERLRVPPLLVGLTVVAWGTSAPEMAVSLRAAASGQTHVALGNVIGSNIFNIAVILGLGAVLQPIRVRSQILRFDAPVLVGASVLAVVLLADGELTSADGALLLTGLVGYTGLTLWMQKRAAAEDQAAFAPVLPPHRRSAALALLLAGGGLALLVVGADAMVRGATALAQRAGVSESVVGLTIVAAGTSLPELLTTAVAAARKQADIAIGNVVGSNLFNLLGILGVSACLSPLPGGELGAVDLWVMAGLAVVVVPLLWSRFTLHRWEGGLLLLSYAVYLGWRWP